MPPKQTATPPSTKGQGEPQTAIRRPSNQLQGLETPHPIVPMEQVGRSIFRDSVESPTTFSTIHLTYHHTDPTTILN
jgi:hypothetical protein